MKKQPLMMNGQRVGKFGASWMLFKESWRYLQADKEIVAIPFLMGLLNILLFGLVFGVFFFLVLGGSITPSEEDQLTTAVEWAFIFAIYVAGAFTVALSQAAITHTVLTRTRGGDATVGDSLRVAFSRSGSLFLWALITSTVGLFLRMIAERSKMLGRIIIALVGVAWSVLTYFVVPAMVIERYSALNAIKRSGQVFRSTWGETLVSNVSLGLVFLVWYVILIASAFGCVAFVSGDESGILATAIIVLFVGLFFISALVQTSLEVILKTLLYLYAIEGVTPDGFNQELLQNVLQKKESTSTIPPPATSNPAAPPNTTFS